MNEVQWNDLAHRLKTVLLQLSNESTIFERLVYKNTNQHRRSLYFRRLVQVRRELRLLQAARLSQLIENVGECHKIMTESRDGETVTIEINDLKRRVYGAVSLTQQVDFIPFKAIVSLFIRMVHIWAFSSNQKHLWKKTLKRNDQLISSDSVPRRGTVEKYL